MNFLFFIRICVNYFYVTDSFFFILYKGYTSLGKTTDTRPNPALLKKSVKFSNIDKTADKEKTIVENGLKVEEEEEFWPAYMLADWSLERAGRWVYESHSGCPSVCVYVSSCPFICVYLSVYMCLSVRVYVSICPCIRV